MKIMKYIILIVLSIILKTTTDAQKVIRTTCDESVNWDYNFNYSGFIIEEAGVSPLEQVQNKQIQILISDINDPTSINFSETHQIGIDRTGYFNIEIGSMETTGFSNFINSMNGKENSEYIMEVYLITQDDTKLIGSKKILPVPYALVSNALGGLGRQGQDGPQGPSGAQGERGPQGARGLPGSSSIGTNGVNGFGIMKMTNTPPNGAKFYVDDGTNTSDGNPHIRYNNNGTWIDL